MLILIIGVGDFKCMKAHATEHLRESRALVEAFRPYSQEPPSRTGDDGGHIGGVTVTAIASRLRGVGFLLAPFAPPGRAGRGGLRS